MRNDALRQNADSVPVWKYDSRTGMLSYGDKPLTKGYSGRGVGFNNPAFELVQGTGPIPRGRWKIGKPITHQRLGPVAIPLTRIGAPLGRFGFLIHGDNRKGDQSASSGCIILDRITREMIARSSVRILEVV